MLRVKDDSVSISHLTPGMVLGLQVCTEVYAKHGYDCVVTSGNDGKHSLTSLHYSNNAVDLRTNELKHGYPELIKKEIKYRLGIDFDVVLEPNHIHLELQPRRRPE